MKLLLGLGNIGKEFDNTYHNLGFLVVDSFLNKNQIEPNFKKLKNSLCLQTKFNGIDLIVAKPTTYMNLSGKAVLELMAKFKIKPEDIIVVFDDFDLPLGTVRYRERGTAGTHNGIRSLVDAIGTNFKRVKIGFGVERNSNINLRDLVLSKYSETEKNIIEQSVEDAIKKVEQCIC